MNGYGQTIETLPDKLKDRLNTIFPSFTAYGIPFNGKSHDRNIVVSSNEAIMIRYEDGKYFLAASYDFNPQSLDTKLQDCFDSVKVLSVVQLMPGSATQIYSPIPNWTERFKDIECLILDNVYLDKEGIHKGFKLKFLGLQNIEIRDFEALIQTISNMHELEFLMHKSKLSTPDINRIKEKLPMLSVLLSK